MAFATASVDKVIAYLGYSYVNDDVEYVQAALDAVEALTDSTTSANAVTRIESWLTQLDTIMSAIVTERATEGSTLLPGLRFEGRRYIAWVARALQLEVRSDVIGTSPDAT